MLNVQQHVTAAALLAPGYARTSDARPIFGFTNSLFRIAVPTPHQTLNPGAPQSVTPSRTPNSRATGKAAKDKAKSEKGDDKVAAVNNDVLPVHTACICP